MGARGGGREGGAEGPDGAGAEVEQASCCKTIVSDVLELRETRLHTNGTQQEADRPRDERYGQDDELYESRVISSELMRVCTPPRTCLIHHNGPPPPGGPNAPVAGGIPT